MSATHFTDEQVEGEYIDLDELRQQLVIPEKPLESMNIADVVECLPKLGVGQYAAAFQSEGVCTAWYSIAANRRLSVDESIFILLFNQNSALCT